MNIYKITKFLNKELKVKYIEDSSRNGTQVKACKDIRKVGFAVDASLSTFEKAKKSNVDLLIVHHGLFWKGIPGNRELLKKRINFLRKNKISLYASHLPLDLHKQYGNNIQLCNILGLNNIKLFGKYHGINIGYSGSIKPTSITSIIRKLNIKLSTKCKNILFGKKTIKSIAIVSGGGSCSFDESLKFDLFITGEAPHHLYNETRDQKHNLIIAGHYATETVGSDLQ